MALLQVPFEKGDGLHPCVVGLNFAIPFLIGEILKTMTDKLVLSCLC